MLSVLISEIAEAFDNKVENSPALKELCKSPIAPPPEPNTLCTSFEIDCKSGDTSPRISSKSLTRGPKSF